MQQTSASVLRREPLSEGWERFWLRLPSLASRVRPGQLLAIQPGTSPFDPLIRTPIPIISARAADETVTLLRGPLEAGRLPHRQGAELDILGPIGRGWSIHEQTRNVLLIGGEDAIGALLFLAEVAAARSINVTLLLGLRPDHPALPGALLPPAVEYQVARGADAAAALDLLDPALLRWADALYTTLPLAAYPSLAYQIRGVRLRWEAGFAQGLLIPPMACYVGICDVCLVPESRRPWRACTDGPQCDLRDFVR
jgi:dihydroorotate dehydrogenase electron transfer subunit